MAKQNRKKAFPNSDDIIRRLLQREMEGLSLKTRDVKAEECAFYNAAVKQFNNWSNALRAAGIDPERVSGKRVWSQARVVHDHNGLKRALLRNCVGEWRMVLNQPALQRFSPIHL